MTKPVSTKFESVLTLPDIERHNYYAIKFTIQHFNPRQYCHNKASLDMDSGRKCCQLYRIHRSNDCIGLFSELLFGAF